MCASLNSNSELMILMEQEIMMVEERKNGRKNSFANINNHIRQHIEKKLGQFQKVQFTLKRKQNFQENKILTIKCMLGTFYRCEWNNDFCVEAAQKKESIEKEFSI